jgi:hypothetical protein
MTTSKYAPLIPTYASNIEAVLATATDEDRSQGIGWYPRAGRIVAGIAAWTGLPSDRVAAIMAALSPRNPWNWNVQDTAAFAHAIATGGDMPSATTFTVNRVTAWRLGTGGADWRTAALKVRSFVANILGDTEAVTVDVWAIRVAQGGEYDGGSIAAGRYRAMADAYRLVAPRHGLAPCELQAVTWVTADRIGLGSKRRGRGHAATFKRGTFPLVLELLAA